MSHAMLSPSGAHRWMACPASVVLEEPYPDTSSAYAAEGTVAHEIASKLLTEPDYEPPVGETVEVDGHKVLVTRSMLDYVHDYVARVRQLAEGKELLVERKLPIDHITDEAEASGTGDAIIIGEGEITIVDLKFGAGVAVEAEGNPQLQMYALGAVREYSVLDDFERITMVIDQPRVRDVPSSHTITADELQAFAVEASAAAYKAHTLVSMVRGGLPVAEIDRSMFAPGEKTCQWCKAKAACPALREEVMLAVAGEATERASPEEFAQFVAIEVDDMIGNNYLSIAMSKADMVEDWVKAVRAEVERRLLAGEQVPDYKLVAGRAGPRKWADAAEAEKVMKTSFRLKNDEMYDMSLISPTTAEKRLKDTPKRWARLQPLISRSEGKPSVAHVSDKRPAYVPADTAEELRQFATSE